MRYDAHPPVVELQAQARSRRAQLTAAELTEFARRWRSEETRDDIAEAFCLSRSAAYALARRLGLPRRSYNRAGA